MYDKYFLFSIRVIVDRRKGIFLKEIFFEGKIFLIRKFLISKNVVLIFFFKISYAKSIFAKKKKILFLIFEIGMTKYNFNLQVEKKSLCIKFAKSNMEKN